MNLIIGGTHGLGHEIATELRRRGEGTFVTGRGYDEAKHGAGLKVDISREEDIETLKKYAAETDLEGFFWVAGYGYGGDFSEQPDPRKMARVNFADVLPVAQAAWKKMLRSSAGGNYVVIGSTTGMKARADEAVYAATKHAQVGFTRSLGLESERLDSKVKVALFLPGGMRTPFWEGSEPANFGDFLDPQKVARKIVEQVIKQRKPFYEETIARGSL